jgi:hypothetical protein
MRFLKSRIWKGFLSQSERSVQSSRSDGKGIQGTNKDPSGKLAIAKIMSVLARFGSRTNTPYKAFSFLLLNTHTGPDEVKAEVETLADVLRVMQSSQSFEDDVIQLGDLNASESQLSKLGQIPGIRWAVQGAMTNTH